MEHILDSGGTGRDEWVSDAERWICQINGVLQCKIDIDDEGEIGGVHVVAGMDRDPRHVVRDVESLLKARLDVDVYYKKIGVVQVVDNGQPTESAVSFHPPSKEPVDDELELPEDSDAFEESQASVEAVPDDLPAPIPAILVAEDIDTRVICEEVTVVASEMILEAEVVLRVGELQVHGYQDGPNHEGSDLRLVAEATVLAVAQLIADPLLLNLKEVRIEHIGGETVVVSAIELVEGRQGTTLFGTCRAGYHRPQAAVYSVLDALNRRLSLHGLKDFSEID
ncbi:MAG: hypothetical protein ACI9UQ_002622 [Candidatus Krumholzibacteriia bacterium]